MLCELEGLLLGPVLGKSEGLMEGNTVTEGALLGGRVSVEGWKLSEGE